MNKSDFHKFAGLMAMLDETFGKESSNLKVKVYFDCLEDFDIETVQKSFFLSIKTLKFYPKVAELREIIEGDKDSQALWAWLTVMEALRTVDNYESIRFADDPNIHFVIENMDGWEGFGRWFLKEEPFIQKEFERLYKLALARGITWKDVPDYLIGIFDADNTFKGLTEFISGPVDFHSLLPARETKKLEAEKKKELKN